MWIDALLSRFKIQTKVLFFVVPFALSLAAITLSSFYAASKIESRMEISNTMLKQLSGFKGVFVTMSDFLHRPDEASFKAARSAVDVQARLGQEAIETIDGRADVTELRTVAEQTADISAGLDTLWETRQSELAGIGLIDKGNRELADLQAGISKRASVMIAEARNADKDAKKALKAAQQISELASLASAMIEGYTALGAPEKRAQFFSGNAYRLVASFKLLSNLSPEKAKAIRPLVDERVKAFRKLARDKSGTTADPEMANVRVFAAKMKAASEAATSEAIRGLGEAEKAAEAGERFGVLMRSIVAGSDQIKLKFSELRNEPTRASLEELVRTLSIYREQTGEIAKLVADKDTFFTDLPDKADQAVVRIEQAAKAYATAVANREQVFSQAGLQINGAWSQLTSFAERQREDARLDQQDANTISLIATIAGMAVAALAAFGLISTFKRPIGQITTAMSRLADGALDTQIAGESRADELGDMARALAKFKENAVAKIEIETLSTDQRNQAELERSRNDAEKTALNEQIEFAVASLAGGLRRLSDGDFSTKIESPFVGRLEQLRQDFNGSLARMQGALSQIHESARTIERNTGEMSDAANELAERTQQQAASLEQTAAAVEQITLTVNTSARQAAEVDELVAQAKQSADSSTEVVDAAIAAMQRIEGASGRIEQIISVIEDLAFQTNLLALNAGIEAARAGDAGKGFAVVAMEVRELAQRSAEAAQEIKDLIHASTSEVASGGQLVAQTGDVLMAISTKIIHVADHISLIARSAREQAGALAAVNSQVNQMDLLTQRNATMVEESTAATRELAGETQVLMALVHQFKLEPENAEASAVDTRLTARTGS